MTTQSQLAKYAHMFREPDPSKAWEMSKKFWHETGILVLILPQVDARAGYVAARTARNLGEQIFGKRGNQ
jgi:hypothetical protein